MKLKSNKDTSTKKRQLCKISATKNTDAKFLTDILAKQIQYYVNVIHHNQ